MSEKYTTQGFKARHVGSSEVMLRQDYIFILIVPKYILDRHQVPVARKVGGKYLGSNTKNY